MQNSLEQLPHAMLDCHQNSRPVEVVGDVGVGSLLEQHLDYGEVSPRDGQVEGGLSITFGLFVDFPSTTYLQC